MAENQMAESGNSCPSGIGCPVDEQLSGTKEQLGNNLDKVILEPALNMTDVNSPQGNYGTTNIRGHDSTGYSCPRCGNAYTRPHSLNRHIRFECGVEPQFECPIFSHRSIAILVFSFLLLLVFLE